MQHLTRLESSDDEEDEGEEDEGEEVAELLDALSGLALARPADTY